MSPGATYGEMSKHYVTHLHSLRFPFKSDHNSRFFPQPLTEKHLRLRGPIGPRLLRPFPAFMHLFSFIFPHLFSFQHLFSFIFSTAFPLGRRARNASRSTAISDSSAGPTPKRGQARSEMQSRHLVLGRTLGRFPVGLASRTCLANLSWDVSRAPTTELTTYMI